MHRASHRAATVAEPLRAPGYATRTAGKWHVAAMEETSAAGPHANWQVHMGLSAQGLLPAGISLPVTSPGGAARNHSHGPVPGGDHADRSGLGAPIRHTADAIADLAPGVLTALPVPWSDRIGKRLPADLLDQLTSAHQTTGLPSRPASLAVLLAYPAPTAAGSGQAARQSRLPIPACAPAARSQGHRSDILLSRLL